MRALCVKNFTRPSEVQKCKKVLVQSCKEENLREWHYIFLCIAKIFKYTYLCSGGMTLDKYNFFRNVEYKEEKRRCKKEEKYEKDIIMVKSTRQSRQSDQFFFTF